MCSADTAEESADPGAAAAGGEERRRSLCVSHRMQQRHRPSPAERRVRLHAVCLPPRMWNEQRQGDSTSLHTYDCKDQHCFAILFYDFVTRGC